MLCVFLLAVPVVLADESDDATHRYEIAQARIDVLAAERLVAMDTILEALDEYTTADEIAEADALRDEYAELAELVSTFTSRAGLNEGTEDLREAIQAFRDEVKPMLEEYDLDFEALREEIDAAVEASEAVAEARENMEDTAVDFLQDKYDAHLERMERVLEKISLSHADSDLSALESVLEEYSSYDLSSAIESGEPEQIREAMQDLKGLYEEFRASVKDVIGEPDENSERPHFKMGKAQRTLNMMEATVDDLSALGFDTEELQELYEVAQDSFDAIEAAADAEEGSEVIDELGEEFRENAQAFLEELKDLVDLNDPQIVLIEDSIEAL